MIACVFRRRTACLDYYCVRTGPCVLKIITIIIITLIDRFYFYIDFVWPKNLFFFLKFVPVKWFWGWRSWEAWGVGESRLIQRLRRWRTRQEKSATLSFSPYSGVSGWSFLSRVQLKSYFFSKRWKRKSVDGLFCKEKMLAYL